MGEKVTVELDPKTLAAARAADVDLSRLLADALTRHLSAFAPRSDESKRWYEANKTAVDAYNALLEKHGLFSDDARTF
jgi:post-segregation antitoxin (ccd killing protein)